MLLDIDKFSIFWKNSVENLHITLKNKGKICLNCIIGGKRMECKLPVIWQLFCRMSETGRRATSRAKCEQRCSLVCRGLAMAKNNTALCQTWRKMIRRIQRVCPANAATSQQYAVTSAIISGSKFLAGNINNSVNLELFYDLK